MRKDPIWDYKAAEVQATRRKSIGKWSSKGFVDGIGAGLVIGLPPVLHFGPDWMKQEVAPKVLSGDAVICLAISEAFAGSDVKALRTTARRNAGQPIREPKWRGQLPTRC